MKSYNKILLLMCNWLGDNFWAMQVVPYVKEKYPEAEIYVGTKTHSKDLFYNLIDDNNIFVLNNVISDRHREKLKFKDYFSDLKKIKKEHFDLGVDLTGNRYSALFLFLARVKKRVGLDLHKLSFLYNIKGDKFDYARHLKNRPFETVSTLFQIETPEYLLPVQTAVAKENLTSGIEFSLNRKLALLMPGAGWKEKQWDLNNFVKIGNYLSEKGYTVIIAGSKTELVLCQNIKKQVENSHLFIKPLNKFIALIPCISIAVTNDSGPAHLLAAAGVKTITVFCGNTDPQKCGPIGKNVDIISLKDNNTELDKVILAIEKTE